MKKSYRIAIMFLMVSLYAVIANAQDPVHLWRNSNLIADYITIQDAVDNSQDGDLILVDAGTYIEQVTITTGITLQGAGTDQTIVKSPPKTSLAINGGNWKNLKNQDIYAIIGVKTTNEVSVTIKDLKVDGDNQGRLNIPDVNSYDFQGIGILNTTALIENVYVTQIRGLASEEGFFPPAGYGYPDDQPLGYNHNTGIFAESSATAGDHTVTLTNSYITKFQKTAVCVWGPTLTIDINNNTIQGYGKTMWSTGNAIQIASADMTPWGGGDRRGTTGEIKNNQINDIGFFPPAPGEPGAYTFNPYWGGSTCILIWEGGDNLLIEGNTISRSEYLPSWNSSTTSENGGYTNVGINVVSATNATIRNNTIYNFDEGIIAEIYNITPNIIVSENSVYNNTFEYRSGPGDDEFELNLNYPEVIAFNATDNGLDIISNFGHEDKIYVNDPTIPGCVNGMVGGNPTIDFTNGSITNGDGSTTGAYSVELQAAGGATILHIDTDGVVGADIEIKLLGEYVIYDFALNNGYIEFAGDPVIPIDNWALYMAFALMGIFVIWKTYRII